MGLIKFLQDSVKILEGYIEFSENESKTERLTKLINETKKTIEKICNSWDFNISLKTENIIQKKWCKMLAWFMLKEIIKETIIIEKDRHDIINKVAYLPLLIDYMKENDLDFKPELTEFLIKTGFHDLMGKIESEFRVLANKLPIDKKIRFDYANGKIQVVK